MDLTTLLKELPEIAARADRDRLSVLWPEFESTYPELTSEIKFCAGIEDSQIVLRYLEERISLLKFVRLTTPKLDEALIFIHQFLREKLHGKTVQPKLVGSSSTAPSLCADQGSTDPVDGDPPRNSARRRRTNAQPGQRN